MTELLIIIACICIGSIILHFYFKKSDDFANTCPRCGNILSKDDTHCSKCGRGRSHYDYGLQVRNVQSDNTINNCSSFITSDPNVPKCPKCGSTAITTGARGVNLTSGMIGASKTVNRCANCGHTWKPNGR